MRKSWSLMLLLAAGPIALCYAADPAAEATLKVNGKDIQLAHYAKAFIGSGNVKVEVAPYKSEYKNWAILVYHGIESDWDGKAIVCKVQPAGMDGEDYVTDNDGSEYHTLVIRPTDDGKKKIEMYVPGVKGPTILVPSDGAAQLTSPMAIFQEYQKQKAKSK